MKCYLKYRLSLLKHREYFSLQIAVNYARISIEYTDRLPSITKNSVTQMMSDMFDNLKTTVLREKKSNFMVYTNRKNRVRFIYRSFYYGKL